MILAGDIGGTKTVLALYREVSGQISSVSAVVWEMQAALATALEIGSYSLALALENLEKTP